MVLIIEIKVKNCNCYSDCNLKELYGSVSINNLNILRYNDEPTIKFSKYPIAPFGPI